MKKSQNCVKAVIAFVCTTCKRQLLLTLLQLITFIYITAIENILCTTPIGNFCMFYCNCQLFYGTIANNVRLQLTTFVCTIAIDHFCFDYGNGRLLHAADQH